MLKTIIKTLLVKKLLLMTKNPYVYILRIVRTDIINQVNIIVDIDEQLVVFQLGSGTHRFLVPN